jgi:LPXTG-motif cell wall-anchored protein
VALVGLLASLLVPGLSSADVMGRLTLSPTEIPRYGTVTVDAAFEVTADAPMPLEVRLDATWASYGGTMRLSAITTTGPISCTGSEGMDPTGQHYRWSLVCPWTQPPELGHTATVSFTQTDMRLGRDFVLFGQILFETAYLDTTGEVHPLDRELLTIGTPPPATVPAATPPETPTTVSVVPMTTVATSNGIEPGTPRLPATGRSVAVSALAGSVALASGVAMLIAVRRRRRWSPD